MRPLRKSSCIIVLVACLMLASVLVSAQEPDLVAEWLATVNQARLDAGLAPYSLQSQLSAAAQRESTQLDEKLYLEVFGAPRTAKTTPKRRATSARRR